MDPQSSEEGENIITRPRFIMINEVCTNEDDDTGGINIKNIGGVFIVIFGGIFLAVLTLCVEFTALKFGWRVSCSKESLTQQNTHRSRNNFQLKITLLFQDFCGSVVTSF